MRLYHGTDPESAIALASGTRLDPNRASELHTDGPLGFYLASEYSDAEFFAVRHGIGSVIAYEISPDGLDALLVAGAVYQRIPQGPAPPFFTGYELHIPVALFEVFNDLLEGEAIHVKPQP